MQSSNKIHENRQLVSVIQGPSYCDSGKFYPGVIFGQQAEIPSATAGQVAAGDFHLHQEEYDHRVNVETVNVVPVGGETSCNIKPWSPKPQMISTGVI